jgi:hypothetical protein
MRPLAQSLLVAHVVPTTPRVTAVQVELVAEVMQLDPSTHKFAVPVGSQACPSAAGATQLPHGACESVPRHAPLAHCTPF